MVTQHLKELLKQVETYGELANEEKETIEMVLIADLITTGKELYDKVKTGADAKSALTNYAGVEAYKSHLSAFMESEIAAKKKYKPIIERIQKRFELTEELNLFYLALNRDEVRKQFTVTIDLLKKINRLYDD